MYLIFILLIYWYMKFARDHFLLYLLYRHATSKKKFFSPFWNNCYTLMYLVKNAMKLFFFYLVEIWCLHSEEYRTYYFFKFVQPSFPFIPLKQIVLLQQKLDPRVQEWKRNSQKTFSQNKKLFLNPGNKIQSQFISYITLFCNKFSL